MPFAATWMELETLILSEISQKKTNTIWYHLYLVSNIQHKWTFPQKRKSWTWRIDLWLPGSGWGRRGREREGVGGIGSLGLMDANYCFWNGLTMRSCCVALRTMSRYLQHSTTMGEKIMYTCMCNWFPMLYSGEKKKGVGGLWALTWCLPLIHPSFTRTEGFGYLSFLAPLSFK